MEWQKIMSEKYQQYYWFNSVTGESKWTEPEGWIEPPAKRLKTETPEEINSTNSNSTSSSTSTTTTTTPATTINTQREDVDIAIIVPFRDLHSEQKRFEQLQRFVPEMTSFLQASSKKFHIFIIEQSNDGRRFNRGKLLNIGFEIAKKQHASIFIFHDVDLIPGSSLLPYYETLPEANPVHIARVWNRYSNNKNYFGGIVAFSCEQFQRINGFPNNFWGWGGEDDELIERVKELRYTPTFPTSGSIEDMENMSLKEKLDFLRQHRDWKCQKKWEVQNEHAKTWRSNGLSDLRYEVTKEERIINDYCTKITVDVMLNNHWTDNECQITDTS